jgi:hypothetical protein
MKTVVVNLWVYPESLVTDLVKFGYHLKKPSQMAVGVIIQACSSRP